MIFDNNIADQSAKADYHAARERMATLLHDANQLFIDAFEALTMKKVPTAGNVHTAALLLARQVTDMTDGIGILVAKGSADPCKPLLRTALEAAMGALYIMEADSDRRDLAYQVAHTHNQLKLYRKYDMNCPQGKAFASEMAGDTLWQSLKPLNFDLPKMVQNLERMLERSEFAPIEAEWQAMKTKPKAGASASPDVKRMPTDNPHWYALFHGPKSVRELAKHLDMRAEYEFLYRYWSDTIHAGGVMSQLKAVTIDGARQPVILPLRNPKDLQTCVTVAIAMLLKVGTALINRYAPAEMGNFSAKYAKSIQERYMSLNNAGPIISLPW